MTSTNAETSALFERASSLVEDQLHPGAAEVDKAGFFPGSNLAAIGQLGLFGMVAPISLGGVGLSAAEARAMLRLLSSGCGATTFAFAQHHGATGAAAATENGELRDLWLSRLLSDTLAGTAFAHVRRLGEPVLRATPANDGWVLSGSAPWVTSWGSAEVMSVAAKTDDGRLVWVLLPAEEAAGLEVEKRFDLMVFQATQTVALRFDSLRVESSQVLSVVDFGRWAVRDRALSARPSPLCLGIGDRALAELSMVAPDTAASMEPWWSGQLVAAEDQCQLVDDAIVANAVDDALVATTAAARSAALLAVQRLTTTLLAASGGSAIERGHTAQRLSREALFYVIQAQSPDGKAATIDALVPGQS